MTRLSDIGPLVGRMLDGRVLVEGTVTGNRADLVSTGTAVFSGIKVDDTFDALTLNAAFEAHAAEPRRGALIRADVKADATLVTVSGRAIPELKATVDYADSRYRFEATANETGRTITAAGDLALLEGGREVTVNRAAFTAGPATWVLADAGPVRVRYQNGLLTLPQPVTLVNNGQQLSAVGTFALTDDVTGSLDVEVSGVNLTELGALLLSKRQLAGTITGDARISGSVSTRNIVGNVKLLAGIVDGYAFQSLDTLVNYRNGRAQVDAILIQSPTSKLEATGSIPFSLIERRADRPADDRGHHERRHRPRRARSRQHRPRERRRSAGGGRARHRHRREPVRRAARSRCSRARSRWPPPARTTPTPRWTRRCRVRPCRSRAC